MAEAIGTIIMLIVGIGLMVGFWYLVKAAVADHVKKKSTKRRCLACGYEGKMKAYSRYGLPQFIALFLLFLFVIPGLIYIGFISGKYKCPQCGALAKNIIIKPSDTTQDDLKKCPFCAEMIKKDAIKCKHCASELL